MGVLCGALIGFSIQLAGLTAFVLVARTSWAFPGKQGVVLITLVAMAALLFLQTKDYTVKRLAILSVLLALGYLLAFHVLGALAFPGLLKDMQIPSIEHMRDLFPVFGVLFVLYCGGGILLRVLRRALLRSE